MILVPIIIECDWCEARVEDFRQLLESPDKKTLQVSKRPTGVHPKGWVIFNDGKKAMCPDCYDRDIKESDY